MKKDLNKLSFQDLKKEVDNLDKKKDSISKSALKGTPFVMGEKYLIRTVTMIYTGRLQKVYDNEFVLTECAWIPETKRWAETMEKGEFEEVEPYPSKAEVIISRQAILDMTKVDWELPGDQK